MQTTEKDVTLTTADGPMDAVLAMPEGAGPFPALVVAQEAFGVNDHIRDVCRRLAGEGYVALAPELYHRAGRGLAFEYSELPRARQYLQNVSNDDLTMDVTAALAHLRSLPEVAPARCGIIGFCMGGFVSFLAACRTDVAVAVVFYGAGIVSPRPGFKLKPTIGEAENIRGAVLGHFGGQDQGIPLADVDALRERLKELGKDQEILVYPDAGHGFFCDRRPGSYHAESAAQAWSRTLEWLKEKL